MSRLLRCEPLSGFEHAHAFHAVALTQRRELLEDANQESEVLLGSDPEVMKIPPEVVEFSLLRSHGQIVYDSPKTNGLESSQLGRVRP